MLAYEQISKVNSEIKMIDLKGKNYAMVPERVDAFRKLFPEGFINTEIISHDGTTVLMQAKAGYYEDGVPIVLGTGFAQEIRGKGLVNGTSYIENCETSAVGRALGMMGLGINGGGICSAEELVNAITAQNQMKQDSTKKKDDIPKPEHSVSPTSTVSTGSTVPPVQKGMTDEQRFVSCCVAHMKQEIEGFNFPEMRKILIAEKAIANKGSAEMTMDEAFWMIVKLYQRFASMAEDEAKAKVTGMMDMFFQETSK